MFAAAAVAAAAALTAITTTTATVPQNAGSSSNNPNTSAHNNATTNRINERPLAYISWTQYAHQRRNSLQRRKIEISKRLEKASNANKRNLASNSNINSNNLAKETNAFKIRSESGGQSPSTQSNQRANLNSNNGESALHFLKMSPNFDLNSLLLNQDESMVKNISAEICNEFLKIHRVHDDELAIDELERSERSANNPTYNNFNFLNSLQTDSEGKPLFDINEISQALLEYMQTQNLGLANPEVVLDVPNNVSNHVAKTSSETYNKFSNASHLQRKNTTVKKEENLNYLLTHRWDPKWLKTLRRTCCIPFAILTLVFLIFTNISSNWIKFEDNQRAGLWAVCNKTKLIDKLDNMDLINTNNLLDNENSTSLMRKIKKVKILFDKTNAIEDCYSKFFLKEGNSNSHMIYFKLALCF